MEYRNLVETYRNQRITQRILEEFRVCNALSFDPNVESTYIFLSASTTGESWSHKHYSLKEDPNDPRLVYIPTRYFDPPDINHHFLIDQQAVQYLKGLRASMRS